MKRISYIVFIIIALGTCHSLSGQSMEGEAFINQIGGNTERITGTLGENEVTLVQTGFGHQSQIRQTEGVSGSHLARVGQFGLKQFLELTQTGANNVARTGQFGYKNEIDLHQKGEFINSTVIQLGSNNFVEQELGSSEASFTVVQFGNNHGLIDRGFNPNSPGYTIQQSGLMGVTVTVTHQ